MKELEVEMDFPIKIFIVHTVFNIILGLIIFIGHNAKANWIVLGLELGLESVLKLEKRLGLELASLNRINP
jgi:small basic protein